MQQIIYAMGDVHLDFEQVNAFIDKKIRNNKDFKNIAKDDNLEIIIIQCGDFGFFWPGFDNSKAIKNTVDFLKDGFVKIYWCHGNHEDHDELDYIKAKNPHQAFYQVAPNIYYAPFASVLTLIDGTKIMFCGGAESAVQDRQNRITYENKTNEKIWWTQEGISNEDIKRLPNTHIDWIVSHARPIGIPLKTIATDHQDESSQYYLEDIRKKYKPSRWFHGHYHVYEYETYEECTFMCLNESQGKDWCKQVRHINKKQNFFKKFIDKILCKI